jgi:hypothetical protein
MEVIGVFGFFSKNIPNEVAGVLWSLMGIGSLIGLIIEMYIGAFVYTYDAGYPFLAVAGFDFLIFFYLLGMIALGKFKNFE